MQDIINTDLRQESSAARPAPLFIHSTDVPSLPICNSPSSLTSSHTNNNTSGETSFRRVQLLYRLMSRQSGLLLLKPKKLRTRGNYRPPLSACQVTFRYGTKYFVFKEDDFNTNASKLIELNLDLLPNGTAVRVQQGLFRTSVYPLQMYRFIPRTNDTADDGQREECANPTLKSILELSFPVEYADCTGEVVASIEIEWLFLRRPFCLGPLSECGKEHNGSTVTTWCEPLNESMEKSLVSEVNKSVDLE